MPQFSVKMGEIEWAMWANEQAVAGAFSKSQISHDSFNESLQQSSQKVVTTVDLANKRIAF